MILVDTSVWIEFFRGRDPIFSELAERLEETNILALECVFAELLQGAKGIRERSLIREMWDSLPHFDETEVLLRAGEESGQRKWKDLGVGLIDAWIVTAARLSGSQIWSLDKKMLSILSTSQIYSA